MNLFHYAMKNIGICVALFCGSILPAAGKIDCVAGCTKFGTCNEELGR